MIWQKIYWVITHSVYDLTLSDCPQCSWSNKSLSDCPQSPWFNKSLSDCPQCLWSDKSLLSGCPVSMMGQIITYFLKLLSGFIYWECEIYYIPYFLELVSFLTWVYNCTVVVCILPIVISCYYYYYGTILSIIIMIVQVEPSQGSELHCGSSHDGLPDSDEWSQPLHHLARTGMP